MIDPGPPLTPNSIHCMCMTCTNEKKGLCVCDLPLWWWFLFRTSVSYSWHEMLLCKDTLLIHFPFSLLEEETHWTCIMRRSFSLSFFFSLTLADLHIRKLPRIRNETWSTLPDNRHAFTPIPILYRCTSDMYSFTLLLHLPPPIHPWSYSFTILILLLRHITMFIRTRGDKSLLSPHTFRGENM